jgi:hypothetical protein
MRIFVSLAYVAELQLTYNIFLVFNLLIKCKTCLSIPEKGGSRITISGDPF